MSIMRWLLGCCSTASEPAHERDEPPTHRVFADDVEGLFASSTMTVLTGCTESWRGRQWSIEWLERTLGTAQVRVAHKDKCGNVVSHEESLQLSHFIRNCDDHSWCPPDTIPYIDNFDVSMLLPSVQEDIPSEQLFGAHRTLVIYGGFLGPSGSSTRLHVDSEDNLIFCAFGRKLFILLPPCALNLIDYEARNIPLENPWDPAVTDKVKSHPMFRKCSKQVRTVVLGAGDLLVQPKNWSHWVYNLELSFSVACWAKACPAPQDDGAVATAEIVLDDREPACAERV